MKDPAGDAEKSPMLGWLHRAWLAGITKGRADRVRRGSPVHRPL